MGCLSVCPGYISLVEGSYGNRSTNDATYLAGNEVEQFCAILSETSPLQSWSPTGIVQLISHMARDRNVAIAIFDLYVQTWSVRACGKQAYPKTELQSGDRLSSYSHHLAGVSLRAANIVDNVTEDCALQQAS